MNRHCSKSRMCFAKESGKTINTVVKTKVVGDDRFYGDTRSIELFLASKLKMLRKDMLIEPTREELDQLYSLNSMVAIDNMVHSIIDRHWVTT